MKKTLGGDRLGAGKRQKVELHGYERSTHDLSYLWRSTMSAGTLVPFMKILALPGDTFDINLDCDVKTHPTIGPLFGSFKVQLDTFVAPIRLYQGQLHNNKLGIGMDMSKVKLPILELTANPIPDTAQPDTFDYDNCQINPSCILSYLGIRGVGGLVSATPTVTQNRNFNAIPLLAYWEIYKNYYANKQEEVGAVIHTPASALVENVTSVQILQGALTSTLSQWPTLSAIVITQAGKIKVNHTSTQPLNQIIISSATAQIPADQIGTLISDTGGVATIEYNWARWGNQILSNWDYINPLHLPNGEIEITTFDLTNIDEMRENILAHALSATAYKVNDLGLAPYNLLTDTLEQFTSMMQSQEGLAIKTYQSDLFNNWLNTDWIDGTGGITDRTTIDTTDGLTMDTLVLTKKVYDLLNRIAVSGGSYDDWLDVVYDHERMRRAESPMYMGGLIKELVFQEVVSNSQSDGSDSGNQPLGTLAGKGILSKKHKGGNVVIKVDEPSYIIGIMSLTPRIDYSQGNEWDTHLLTMDDLHKPGLDEIGFQELITEQMAWWNTHWDGTKWLQKSAGKQPAWINYMTNLNKTYGNFAVKSNEMFMTLNRQYTPVNEAPVITIEDLTTYIDPAKYNQIFAQTSLDAQNFWTQIAVDITARRKMSARVMPNL
ncbi:MAG: major capsid protein [Microviridae sp.]|nr:MAG: major capsid protein [Microviridae sp.]